MDAETIKTIASRLKDRMWRLCNLYSIKDKESGRIIKFVPREEQLAIYRALEEGFTRIIIIKARRLGFSTGIDVFAADAIAFNSGFQASIVDQNQADASLKLNNVVKVALEKLPKFLWERVKVLGWNEGTVKISTLRDTTPSAIYAGKNARGGTNQLLHISEWGVIQADDPTRSEEILTGALPSAEGGVVIVETTWKGGKGGHLWNLVQEAINKKSKTKDDWRLYFFPWWVDPSNCDESPDLSTIPAKVAQYLAERETELQHALSPGQKCWYARKAQEQGIFMMREFPTTLDECFRAPIEGAIYADLIAALQHKGAIRESEVDRSALVHTFWDRGSPINTVCWYAQFVGAEIRIIDCDANLDLTPVERVSRMLGKGYNYGFHFLPHDAAATETSGRSFQSELDGAGLKNTKIISRTIDVWIGINRLRSIMPRMTFRLPATEYGVNALGCYHTRRVSPGGIATDEPVHDWSSHPADGLRMLAEAEMAGLISGSGMSFEAMMAARSHNPVGIMVDGMEEAIR